MHRPDRSPGQRYRFEQYLGDLRAAGVHCDVSWLLSEDDDRCFYSRGHILRKAGIVVRSYIRRWEELRKIGNYDTVFIFREALMTGSTFVERGIARSRARMILDFDDAIWLPQTSRNNRFFRFLKRPSKLGELAAMSDLVIAGNEYLAAYARRYQQNTVVIPTTIDFSVYHTPVSSYERTPVVIGWTGSITTIPHFRLAESALLRIRERYGSRVRFKVIGDSGYTHPEIGISGISWTAACEVQELQELDIGIMPLPDDAWARGKCACKGLQYMALGIPTVLSALGMNTEVVQHGENGLLATTEDEWYEALCALIESPELRSRLGRAGRATVEQRYSRQAWSSTFVRLVSGE